MNLYQYMKQCLGPFLVPANERGWPAFCWCQTAVCQTLLGMSLECKQQGPFPMGCLQTAKLGNRPFHASCSQHLEV